MSTPTTLTFDYQSFPLTRAIHLSPARFRVLDCGRRLGKSYCAIAEAFRMGAAVQQQQHRMARGLVLAPTFDLVREDWRIASELFRSLQPEKRLSDLSMLVAGVVELTFRSADSQAGAGRGKALDFAIFDEASRIPELVWEEDVRPALADRQGRAVFLSTPCGKNWFYRAWLRGQDPRQPDWASWRAPTIDGWRSRLASQPEALAAAEAEWVSLQRSMSQRSFQQEFLADFLEATGSLWDPTGCLRGSLRGALPGRTYVAGLDPARAQDWMALVILEVESRQLVALHRVQHRSWRLQLAETVQLVRQYPDCRVLIDGTGLGDPIAERLQEQGCSMEVVRFNETNKRLMVENLGLAIDQSLLGIPHETETAWLLEEVSSFRETTSEAGHVRYGAPEGLHDDGVTALMLAAWLLRHDWRGTEAVTPEPTAPSFTYGDWMAFTRHRTLWRRVYGAALPPPATPLDPTWAMNARFRRALARELAHG